MDDSDDEFAEIRKGGKSEGAIVEDSSTSGESGSSGSEEDSDSDGSGSEEDEDEDEEEEEIGGAGDGGVSGEGGSERCDGGWRWRDWRRGEWKRDWWGVWWGRGLEGCVMGRIVQVGEGGEDWRDV